MLRLKGRGLTFEDNVGDQYVEILVVIPADINDEDSRYHYQDFNILITYIIFES